ncbi:MAG: MFS transporter [Simkaniaceae bacterium]|nr:MFS transporter [Simkaniaceae bacterium]
MKGMMRLIAAPLISLIIIMLGNGFFNTFVSMRISIEGGANWLTGLLYSSYYAGLMIGSIFMEGLIRRIGHIRAFSIFASLTAVIVMVQGMWLSMASWFLMRFCMGIACAGLFIVIESWLLLLSSPHTRGKVLSIYMVCLYGAQGSGQYILNFVDLKATTPFEVTVILSALAVIPVCIMRASYPNLNETEMVSIWYLLKKSPLGFFGCLASGFILSAFYALGPIFGREMHYSVFQISLVMGLTIFGGLALQWPLGHISDIIERRKVIIAGSFALAILAFVLTFARFIPFPITLLIFILFGGFSFTLYPLSITYCCDFFSAAGVTAITCACCIVYGIGCIIGPILAPIVMALVPPVGLFLYITIIASVLGIFGLVRSICRPPPPKELHEEYVPLPRTTPQAVQLDPRPDEES